MLDSAAQRANMVACQLRTNDVSDARVRNAMLDIRRERFVPAAAVPLAYMEGCIALKSGRFLMDARSFGKLLQLATILPDDLVLDLGCGMGYSSAVLSLIAGRVVALEEDAELAGIAEQNLRALGTINAEVVRGPLAQGWPEAAPFDVIVVNGAIEEEPAGLVKQLKSGGRLVTIWHDGAAGHGRLYVNDDGAVGNRSAFDAQVPVLPGFEKRRSFAF
ncbi:MAG: protein-L-isoaspartate(D-aspartate) O-methyltransferase [Alphaproteobacteria bacterium]|jgi:protein-L-isoaspartate(D-aspartate) O-methyltransferase|nr:protein-L-isoaspartate(D-aspartate) O-methyltransferase [Alphaproteobacteria bacterium]